MLRGITFVGFTLVVLNWASDTGVGQDDSIYQRNQTQPSTVVRRWAGANIKPLLRPASDEIRTEIIVSEECLKLMRNMEVDLASIEDYDTMRIVDARTHIPLEMQVLRTTLAVELVPDRGDGITRFKVSPSFGFKPPIGHAWTMDHETWIRDPAGKLKLEKKAIAWTALSF